MNIPRLDSNTLFGRSAQFPYNNVRIHSSNIKYDNQLHRLSAVNLTRRFQSKVSAMKILRAPARPQVHLSTSWSSEDERVEKVPFSSRQQSWKVHQVPNERHGDFSLALLVSKDPPRNIPYTLATRRLDARKSATM
jgi:hypothetical protein